MDDTDLRLDGNALGGTLEELFGAEMTASSGACARCGRVAEIGAQHLYRYRLAPGAVLRCAACGNVLLVVVPRPGGARLTFSGLRWFDREGSDGDPASAAAPASATDPASAADAGEVHPDGDDASAAASFVTTEHFALQGARSSTIAESTGRATMFLGAVTGGLVALGLVATATSVGAAFYAFGLILLPTLAFLGYVTFDRVLQSGVEDRGYAYRIARLRAYYFEHARELDRFLLSVPPEDRLRIQGLPGGRFQRFLTIAGMVGVITAVLAGSAAGLLTALLSGHSLAAALVAGVLVAIAVLAALMRVQHRAWQMVDSRAAQTAQRIGG